MRALSSYPLPYHTPFTRCTQRLSASFYSDVGSNFLFPVVRRNKILHSRGYDAHVNRPHIFIMKQLLPPFVLRARVWRIQNCALTFVYVNYQHVPIYLFEMIKIDSLRPTTITLVKIHSYHFRPFADKNPFKNQVMQVYKNFNVCSFIV